MISSDIIKSIGIKPIGYKKNKSVVIIETKDNKYVIKPKKKDKKDIFDYLKSRSFNYFPEITTTEDYEITNYYEEYNIPDYEKAKDLMSIVSILHTKTTHYENVDLDDMKKIYEEQLTKIEELYEYYSNLNDIIDEEIYMSPSNYLLVRNISKIYSLLTFCKNELDNWYESQNKSEKERVALIHNNLELDHLIRNENSYLISWDNAKIANPIYDLCGFYKKYYNKFDFSEIFNIYESRYPLNDNERKLFFILISIPDKLNFVNNEYENSKIVNELLLYIYKTDKFISKYYSNEQDEKQNDFQE